MPASTEILETTLQCNWGQNSINQATGTLAQQNLSYYCQSTDLNIIPIAFLTKFKGANDRPILNFANQGDNCSFIPGTQQLDLCPEIEKDIATCQTQYHKTILLSIGGDTFTNSGFDSADQAATETETIWATFGPQNQTSKLTRPFGPSVIDGFDIDVEAPVAHMTHFAKRLRSLMDNDNSKTWTLTASPQCPYPDKNNKDMLSGVDATYFDALFVQYYNNAECDLRTFDPTPNIQQKTFNFQQWENWADNDPVNKNKKVKFFLGVLAST